MKNNSNSSRAAILIAVCAIIGFTAGIILGRNSRKPKNGEHTITICATTDIHGAYFSQSYTDGEANETSLSNVSTFIGKLRSEGIDPILIDVGDALQGDNAAYYYNYIDTTSEHVFASIAKYLKYDALVVGNHDIEAGPAVYNRMKSCFKRSYLAANAIISDGPQKGRSYFPSYTVIKRDGLKIAIIGMTNANIKNWLPEEKWKGMDFLPISEMEHRVIEVVRTKVQPDIVLLAIHSGTGNGFPGIENEALYVASSTEGIDLVFCGHDHKAGTRNAYTINGTFVPVLDAGTKASSVAVAELHVNVSKHKVTSITKFARIEDMKDYPLDAAYDKKFEKQFNKVKMFANQPVGKLTEDIDFAEALTGPSSYISLVQKVQMEASGADISFAAPLTSKGGISKGDIAFKDLAKIYKFENQLYVAKMTGTQIKDYLEYSYDTWIGNSAPPFNFDSADGIIYEVRKSAAKGSRVNIISMADGTPFEPGKTYEVAMTSYRASGGGNLLRLGAGIDPSTLEIVRKYDDIRDLIGKYIKDNGTITTAVSDNWKWVE